MFAYNAAYRHLNCEVEGFTGCGTTKDSAKLNAIARIKAKCQAIGDNYDCTRIIESFKGLPVDEVTLIANDWRLGF